MDATVTVENEKGLVVFVERFSRRSKFTGAADTVFSYQRFNLLARST